MYFAGGRRAARARADQSYTQFAVMDDENVSALQQVTSHKYFAIRLDQYNRTYNVNSETIVILTKNILTLLTSKVQRILLLTLILFMLAFIDLLMD